MRGEIDVGNLSCGMGTGVLSIEVRAREAELKNASRMFRPTMPDAVSKSGTGIFTFLFRLGYVVTADPPDGQVGSRASERLCGLAASETPLFSGHFEGSIARLRRPSNSSSRTDASSTACFAHVMFAMSPRRPPVKTGRHMLG
jgi:hypothetical protein